MKLQKPGRRFMQKFIGADTFILNTSATDSRFAPEITALTDGSYVVTWVSSLQDGSSGELHAQRFGAGGLRQGPEFRVGTHADAPQKTPAISRLTDGGYVISWAGQFQDSSGWGIFAQHFTVSGEPSGTEFQVNTITLGDQQNPAVRCLDDGGYVITWNSSSPDGNQIGIYSQRFSKANARVGGETLVSTNSAGGNIHSSLIALTDGSQIVAWQSDAQDGAGFGVCFQRYALDGTASGAVTRINTTTAGSQHDVHLAALPDGGFVASWTSLNAQSDVLAQRFSANGVRVGEETKASSTPGANTSDSAITALPDGGYLVFWQSATGGAASAEIHAQRYGASGAAIDAEFLIAADASQGLQAPSASPLADGGFVVTWTSGATGNNQSVMTREFHPESAILQLPGNDTLTSTPRIAPLSNGSYVVIWESGVSDDSTGTGVDIYAQRFDAYGEKINGAVRVNTTTEKDQYDSSITGLPDGGYIVVWSQELNNQSFGLYSQRFDAEGNPSGGEVQVNAQPSTGPSNTQVLALADGGYAVTWTSYTLYGAHDIFTRRYGPDGTAASAESRVNTTIAGSQLLPAVSALADGGYIVAWSDASDYYAAPAINIQRYAANGTAIGSEVRVDSVPAYASNPSVAGLADGGFVVVFDDAQSNQIYSRRYGQNGMPVASDIQIPNPDATTQNRAAQAIALPDGGYIVAWQRATAWQGDGYYWVTVAQRFDPNGNTVGPEQQINFTTNAQQGTTELAVFSDGRIAGAWIESTGIGHGMVLPQVSGIASNSNLIIGSTSSELLSGTLNPDIIHGLAGNDTLDGNLGGDTLLGGAGDDVYIVDSARDVAIESANEGIDLIKSSVSCTASVNIENLMLLGTAAINATGNALANTLTGNTGANILDGAAGADTLIGGAGDDTYVFNRGSGQDTVRAELDSRNSRLESLRFGSTVLPGDVRARLVGTTLELSIANTSDKIAIEGFYIDSNPSNPFNPIQQVVFSDGSATWNLATLLTLATASTVTGTTGNDVLNGTAKADALYGLAGNDVLVGLAGNDTLDGGSGSDKLMGGAGDDTYIVDVSTDLVTELAGEGNDLIQASLSWTLGANVENLRLTGSDGLRGTGNALANRLTGNSGANVLDGLAGADTLVGGAGNDTYVVDAAGDVLIEATDEGTDSVQSAVSFTLPDHIENLVLIGAALNATGNALGNVLAGNAGANVLDGQAGADTMAGGAGNDTYVVDSAGDVVTEAATQGTDLILSSVSFTASVNVESLTLTGSTDLNATGNDLANVLVGNSGANVLDGLAGADKLAGGAGNDTYVVDVAGDTVTELAGGGTDLVRASLSWTLGANTENLTLTGMAALNATGNALANVLTGNAGANVLSGLAGADTMIGSAGNDTYVVDATGDVVTELAGEGTDLVQSTVSWTLADNIENLTITGAGTASGWIFGVGNALNNVLTGGSGVDYLDGRAGADTMAGGLGNDIYVVDQTGDIVTEKAGEGTDTVRSGIDYSLGSNVEGLELQGEARSGTGNALANTVTGNLWDNTLDGGAGADKLIGGAGDDIYVVDAAGDVVTELANEGTDLVRASLSWTLGAHTENLTLTGTAALMATGNALANLLTGNTGANMLDGGIGADTLIGGAGSDTLKGGAGNDVYVLGRGDGADTLIDSDATAGNADTLSFLSGVTTQQLWFRHTANDLEVSIIGTGDKVTVKNWYLGSNNHVEQFRTADNKVLIDSAVDKLVNAMATFAPPASGQTTLSPQYQASLGSVLVSSWS
jgi:Ca2+-binding RTX toxin-like protein